MTSKKAEGRVIDAEPGVSEPKGATPNDLAVFEGHSLRVTDDKKRMSVFDIIAATGDKNPRTTWENLKQQHPEVVEFAYNLKFTGRGQKETPTVDKKGLYHLLFLLPGKRVAPFRVWAATTLDRVIEGDISLAEEIVNRAAQNNPVASVQAPANLISMDQAKEFFSAAAMALIPMFTQAIQSALPHGASVQSTYRTQPASPQAGLPLRPPADDQSKWYWPSDISRKLNIPIREVWETARELRIDSKVYQREQRRRDGSIGAQFHQWAANEIARRVNQLRRSSS